MASSTPDPSEFAASVAVGYARVLDTVLGFLERTSPALLSPVLAFSLALLAPAAYLVAVTLAFAVRAVAACGEDAAGLAPAAVLGWFANAALKLAVALLILSGLAVALFCYGSVPWSRGLMEH